MTSLVLAAALATATATPAMATKSYRSGSVRSISVGAKNVKPENIAIEQLSSVDFAAAVLKGSSAWIVTATSTATPWPVEQPTPTGDCCAHGHAWQPMKAGREHAGGNLGLHYGEWNRRGLKIDARSPEFDKRTWVTVQRCRRCGLWKEKP